jgi:hypothetical protein
MSWFPIIEHLMAKIVVSFLWMLLLRHVEYGGVHDSASAFQYHLPSFAPKLCQKVCRKQPQLGGNLFSTPLPLFKMPRLHRIVNRHSYRRCSSTCCSVASHFATNSDAIPIPLNRLPSSTIYLYENSTRTHVYLVGTFHLSKISANDVRTVIRATRPRAVMVELCPDRYVQMFGNRTGLNQNASTAHRNVSQILTMRRNGNSTAPKSGTIRIGKALSGIYNTYRHSGVAVGGEFHAAQEEAKKLGDACHLVLGDMDAKETLDLVSLPHRSAEPRNIRDGREDPLASRSDALPLSNIHLRYAYPLTRCSSLAGPARHSCPDTGFIAFSLPRGARRAAAG